MLARSPARAAKGVTYDLPGRIGEVEGLRRQYGWWVLISSSAVSRLGSPPRLTFGEEPKPSGAWAGRRLLCLDEKPAFELSFRCGTCQFLFRRLEGAAETLSLAVVRQRLTDGLTSVDGDVCAAFGALLPEDDYLPMLLEVVPRLTWPMKDGDYFAEEQVSTWGLSTFWGLPEYPSTPTTAPSRPGWTNRRTCSSSSSR
jgi:hypothetical protein